MNYRLKLEFLLLLLLERHEMEMRRVFESEMAKTDITLITAWLLRIFFPNGLYPSRRERLDENSPRTTRLLTAEGRRRSTRVKGSKWTDWLICSFGKQSSKKMFGKRKTAEDLFSFPTEKLATKSKLRMIHLPLQHETFLMLYRISKLSAKYLTAAGNAKSISFGMTFKNVRNVVLCNWNGQN